MARPGMHKAEKRRKELMRQKKQEEKRKKRLEKGAHPENSPEAQIENLSRDLTENPEEQPA